MKFLLLFLVSFNLFAIDISAWKEYKPGGSTKCARGGEYSFFVKEGDPRKIVIDFMGGGACWNKRTCKVGSRIFFDS
ncbi:MAG: esterase, partial [Deltaproteobacteria bacterium]